MWGSGTGDWLAWDYSKTGDHGAKHNTSTRGSTLKTLDSLIREAEKFTDRSRTTLLDELRDLKNRARYCLADVGPAAQASLRTIGNLQFPVITGALAEDSQELIYKQLVRLLHVLEEVRTKIENGQYAGPFERSKRAPKISQSRVGTVRLNPNGPYSKTDKELYELIAERKLAVLTDSELWKRFRLKFREIWPLRDQSAFRCSVYRIRRYHGIPTPKKTA